ncbi:alcohol dehydrogenase catalytic domain-containing protein [Sphingomonas colocasiae]|uniref:Zinc-binding dehydrogenase n=1 Tax=Sphingomonas colocasiae TaxID=1848973 RepID=A0ABS7PWH4_9SPHN|nr:zinc-binding dehydrogenase [Sphingomonas colocasiae]MBY8825636.1 zinc-binding dehydrogenase [Sphingomonas colocasiae]
MKALLLREIGVGPAIGDVADPVPGEGEVLVRMVAAALNHRELWIAKGQYPGMVLPATLGADGAGVIAAVGRGVDPARIGERVMLYPGLGWGDDPRFPAPAFGLLGMPGPGTIAEYVSVPAANAVAKPDHLDFAQAAALPLAGITAWRGLVTKAGLLPGERLLICGAGGGVAAQALAFAIAMGAETWVTSGSDETIAWARARGAAGGVNYRTDDWGKALRRQAGGFDVVFDGAPAGGFRDYSRSLAMGARIVLYGSTGGASVPLSAPELFLKNWVVTGTNVGNAAEFETMLDFTARHRLVPEIEKRFAFASAAEALGHLENGHGRGKVVIDIAPDP